MDNIDIKNITEKNILNFLKLFLISCLLNKNCKNCNI